MAEKFDAILEQVNDYFKTSGTRSGILNEGFKAIMSDEDMSKQYVDGLCEGCNANDEKDIKQLMENSMQSLMEGIDGILPVHSLACPVIRKLWPRLCLKNALKTQVATSPKLTIPYTKPYIETVDANGIPVKHYLPYSLVDDREGLASYSKNTVSKQFDVKTTASGVIDLWATTAVDGDMNIAGPQSSMSKVKVQPVDKITIASFDYSWKSTVTTTATDVATLLINRDCDIRGNAFYNIAFKVTEASTSYTVSGLTLIVNADIRNGKLYYAVVGTATGGPAGFAFNSEAVTFAVHYSSEYNESSTEVSFENGRADIDIATGEHLNVSLPTETLSDWKATYQIDGTKMLTDTMSNISGLDLDKRIAKFLVESYVNQPTEYYDNLPGAAQYAASFDIQPGVGFAGRPTEWLEELKRRIDHVATDIKQHTYLSAGVFCIVGNPLDVNLITNINWTFASGADVSGVAVDYNIGMFSGANTYKVISSNVIKQGYLWIVFIPSESDQRTYTYFPYTFVVESGYRDPNHANVPSLMLTKRDALHTFMPAIGTIQILGNGGGAAYAPDRTYVPTKAVS